METIVTRMRIFKQGMCVKLKKSQNCLNGTRTHGPTASCRPLAPAPAFLQGSGDRRISSALDAPPCLEGLLRDGETAGRVPAGASDLQSGAFTDYTNSGLCFRRSAGSFSACGEQARQRPHGAGASVCAAISVSGESGECHWALSAIPRAV